MTPLNLGFSSNIPNDLLLLHNFVVNFCGETVPNCFNVHSIAEIIDYSDSAKCSATDR